MGPFQCRNCSLQLGSGRSCSHWLGVSRAFLLHLPPSRQVLYPPSLVVASGFPEVSLPVEDLSVCPGPVELTTVRSHLRGPPAGAVVEGAGPALLLSTGWTCCQLHWADLVSCLESQEGQEWTPCCSTLCLRAEGSRVPGTAAVCNPRGFIIAGGSVTLTGFRRDGSAPGLLGTRARSCSSAQVWELGPG